MHIWALSWCYSLFISVLILAWHRSAKNPLRYFRKSAVWSLCVMSFLLISLFLHERKTSLFSGKNMIFKGDINNVSNCNNSLICKFMLSWLFKFIEFILAEQILFLCTFLILKLVYCLIMGAPILVLWIGPITSCHHAQLVFIVDKVWTV